MRILNSPWWRAPFQLLRRPGVAVSLIAATFVAALPAAAAPLFLGTAQSATVNDQVADACPSRSGAIVHSAVPYEYAGEMRRQRDGVASVLASVPNLGPTQTTAYHMRNFVKGLPKDNPASHPWFITIMARDGFRDHVRVVEKADVGDDPSIYVPDDIAASWKVHAGDTIAISSNTGSTQVRVAAVYKNMNIGHVDRYWCSVKDIFQGNILAENGQPSLVLADLGTVAAIMKDSYTPLTGLYEASLTNPAPSPDQVEATRAALATVPAKLSALSGSHTYYNSGLTLESSLGRFQGRARLVGDTLRPPIYAVSAAGVLVGLLVLGAATLLWTRRREHELMVLAVRGASPLALGVKAVLETLPAILAGGVLATVAARWLVTAVGPAGTLSAAAMRVAIWSSAAVVAVTLLVVLLVATRRSRALTDFATRAHGRGRLAAAPWELLILAAAVPIWHAMSRSLVNDGGDDLNLAGEVVRLPPRTLVVPILVIIGVTLFAARLVAFYLRRRGLKRAPKGHARYLAWRRLGREPMVAATLLAIAAVPAAVAGFGALAAQSVQTTVQDKALASVGADVVVNVSADSKVTGALTRFGPATFVSRVDGLQVDGYQTSMLGVDPARFARVAAVGGALAGPKFGDTLEAMARSGPGAGAGSDAITVLASDPIPAGRQTLAYGSTTLDVTVVRVPTLPGQYNSIPMVIVARGQMPAEFLPVAKSQIWVRTDHAAALAAAVRADPNVDVNGVNIAADLYANTLFEPITYTFEYFVAIALLTGVVVAVGLLLYLESRTVGHRRAYIMLRRMGLKPRAHRAALLWELCGALGLGLAVAAATVAALGFGLRESFDVNPAKQPGTVLTMPTPTLAMIIGCVAVTAVSAALFGHARVARAKPAEVLRDAV